VFWLLVWLEEALLLSERGVVGGDAVANFREDDDDVGENEAEHTKGDGGPSLKEFVLAIMRLLKRSSFSWSLPRIRANGVTTCSLLS